MTGPRLLSLDFYRGLIMVLLALESTGLYEHLMHQGHGTGFDLVIQQFFHHPWNGLRFWDLIQPGFMFIAGTAMALSLEKQWATGVTWNDSFVKILKRCGWLFFWGVLIYAVHSDGLHFELWNVLTQLSFTYLVAFLSYRWNIITQIAVIVGLLLLTEFLYRVPDVPGFDQPFTDQHNFGNYMDLILMNRINSDGWVAINCLPTAAHTIWGAVAGKLLLSDLSYQSKIKKLLIAGAAGLAVGYSLDWFSVTPIIKRIATTSFTLASGGWCLLGLALFYWWIDVRQHIRHLEFFTIVGMNSIFIYLFFSIAGYFFNGYINALTGGLLGFAGITGSGAAIIGSLVVFALEWGLCYFLYQKRIFFRL